MPSEARPFPLIVESKSPCVADAIGALERRLNAFYATNISYYDSAAESDKTLFWEPVAALSRSIVAARPRVRILEVGAGKSQLPDYLSRSFSRKQLDFVAHDINDTNKEFYQQRQVPLLVGSLAELKDEEPFDIIVSFFAYEHMPRPAESLDLMQSLLRSDGRLVIICPKYTCPLYIPPAVRHLSRLQQLLINLRLVLASLATRLTGRPKFYVVPDPAVFHATFRRDLDAVHMVSRADLEAHLGRDWSVEALPVKYPSIKYLVLSSLILLCVVAQRRAKVSA